MELRMSSRRMIAQEKEGNQVRGPDVWLEPHTVCKWLLDTSRGSDQDTAILDLCLYGKTRANRALSRNCNRPQAVSQKTYADPFGRDLSFAV